MPVSHSTARPIAPAARRWPRGATAAEFDRSAARRAAQSAVDASIRFFTSHGVGYSSGVGVARIRIYAPGERSSETTSSNPSPWLDGGRSIRLDFHDGVSDAFRFDIVAHEYAHGVIERYIGTGTAEGRALNEALADVFAIGIEHTDLTVDTRSLATGDSYWNINQYRGINFGTVDNGGEHLTMGVATRPAWFVARRCGTRVMSQIYMDAMIRTMRGLPPSFAGFAVATLLAAAQRYGSHSLEYQSLRAGWDSTGLTQTEIERRLSGTARDAARRLST